MRDLIPLLIAHGALIVFVITLAARVGAPVPAAPLLVVAGGVAMAGQLSLAVTCLVASVIANVLGDAVWYQAGRWRGHRVMKLLCRISLSPDTCVRQSEGILSKWGGSSLIAAKFLPGISVVAAPMAGALGMSWKRFVSYDVGAALIWTHRVPGDRRRVRRPDRGRARLHDGVRHHRRRRDRHRAGHDDHLPLPAPPLDAQRPLRAAHRRQRAARADPPRRGADRDRRALVGGDAAGRRRVPGAIVATLAQLPTTALELPRDREVVLYCNCPNEVSALRGVRILADLGHHRARALHGGLDAWLEIEAVSPLGRWASCRRRSIRARCRRSSSAPRARPDSSRRGSAARPRRRPCARASRRPAAGARPRRATG
jgi:membrane protein DedA with SNARE-associated domain/rhodanese-related sulfurtransferase